MIKNITFESIITIAIVTIVVVAIISRIPPLKQIVMGK